MKKSKNKRVQEFLEEVMMHDSEQFDILQELRKIVFAQYPKVNERMMYGGIMFSLEEDFGGIFAYKEHISFEFGKGIFMDDPNNLLEGTGKLRRHVKIKTFSDIKDKTVAFFVRQAI